LTAVGEQRDQVSAFLDLTIKPGAQIANRHLPLGQQRT